MIKRVYFTMDDCEVNLMDELGDSKELAEKLILKFTDNWIVFGDACVMHSPVEVPVPSDKVKSWIMKLHYIYDTTRERYETLLQMYKEQHDNLLAKIGSTSKTKFNDTPQNVGNFEGEQYTSTYTQVDTSVDPTDMMSRLDNIYNKYKNLYAEWVEEFTPLFGEDIYE